MLSSSKQHVPKMTGIHPMVLLKVHSFRLQQISLLSITAFSPGIVFLPGEEKSCSKGFWGRGKKNLTLEEKGGKKISLRAQFNHPLLRTLERRSIHPPGTPGIACTTQFPLAAFCLSLWTTGRQQQPLPSGFILSCSPPLSALQSS